MNQAEWKHKLRLSLWVSIIHVKVAVICPFLMTLIEYWTAWCMAWSKSSCLALTNNVRPSTWWWSRVLGAGRAVHSEPAIEDRAALNCLIDRFIRTVFTGSIIFWRIKSINKNILFFSSYITGTISQPRHQNPESAFDQLDMTDISTLFLFMKGL